MKHKKFDQLYPYTYLIVTPEGLKYYGVRYGNLRLNINPLEDLGKSYFSSSKGLSKDFQLNTNKFKYYIHYTFDSIEEAIEYENKFLTKVYKRPDWANKTNNKSFEESKINRDYDRTESALKSSETMRNDIVDGENMLIRKARKAVETRIRTGVLMSGARKAHITKSKIGADGLSIYQRSLIKSFDSYTKDDRCVNPKAANDKYKVKLQSMTDDEFEEFIKDLTDKRKRTLVTIRNKT